jgi:hypothetical protein
VLWGISFEWWILYVLIIVSGWVVCRMIIEMTEQMFKEVDTRAIQINELLMEIRDGLVKRE